ncbi:MAG: Hpt domain-containing protein [Rhizobacter sp.]|nr:Hpt domain-containing protein [Bacteriovorax sp.]
MKYNSFNDSNLMQQFKGDEEILLDMIGIFESDVGQLLSPIRESILNQDGQQLRINAHTFKGVMGNFYAEQGKQLAFELETHGKQANFKDTLELLNKLENELQLFLFELNTLKKNLDIKA